MPVAVRVPEKTCFLRDEGAASDGAGWPEDINGLQK
jgi:hypothetical protein